MVDADLLVVIGAMVGAGTGLNVLLFRQMGNRITAMSTDLQKALQRFPKEYVLKDDCIRTKEHIDSRNDRQDKKINKIANTVATHDEQIKHGNDDLVHEIRNGVASLRLAVRYLDELKRKYPNEAPGCDKHAELIKKECGRIEKSL